MLWFSDSAVAGAISGGVTRLVIEPLDVLKVRFQLQLEAIRKVHATSASVLSMVCRTYSTWGLMGVGGELTIMEQAPILVAKTCVLTTCSLKIPHISLLYSPDPSGHMRKGLADNFAQKCFER